MVRENRTHLGDFTRLEGAVEELEYLPLRCPGRNCSSGGKNAPFIPASPGNSRAFGETPRKVMTYFTKIDDVIKISVPRDTYTL